MKLTATGIAILAIMALASAYFWNITANGLYLAFSVVSFVGLFAGVFFGIRGRFGMGI